MQYKIQSILLIHKIINYNDMLSLNKFALSTFLSIIIYSVVYTQTVQPQRDLIKPFEKVVVSYSGFPGNTNDWISIAKAG